jgi:hypothetical protein
MNEAQLKAIKVCIEKGDKAKQKEDDFYIAAGQHLKTLQAAHKERGGTWAEWEALLKGKCGIGKSRTSKLMQIAEKGNSEAIERKFSLPFGFQATFYWGPGELLGFVGPGHVAHPQGACTFSCRH